MKFFGWLTGRKRREQGLDEEIRAHLAMAVRERIEQGEDPAEAEANARREFGNIALVKDVTRDMWGWRWLETLLQDLRYGLRQLRRNPGFTIVAVLTLALGIGANTAIFSVANSVLFPPFAGAHVSRLLAIYASGANRSGYSSSSFPDYLYYRKHSHAFSGVAAFVRVPAAWTHGSTTELPEAELTSSNYFDVLDVKPYRGRFFLPSENYSAGPAHVAVVSYRFWREQMGSSPDIASRTLTLNGQLFTIIGVAPKGFEGVQLDWGGPPDFWLPISTEQTFIDDNLLDKPEARWCLMVGRLRSGMTRAKAASDVRLLATQLEQAYPSADKDRTGLVIPFSEGRIWPTSRQNIGTMLWMLSFFAGLVLLVACADVANLLLARGTSRQKEIGVRLALGATRGRVVRQLLTEGVLISLAGAGVGLWMARWMARWITTFRHLFTIKLALYPAMLDGRVIAFTFSLSVLSAIAFSLAPAYQVSRVNLAATLKDVGAQSSTGGRHRWLRRSLAVSEISIAFIGMAGATMLVHTLWALNSTDLGFDPHQVLSVRTEVYSRHYKPNVGIRFYFQLLGKLRALPGVQQAALAFDSPLTTMHSWKSVAKAGAGGQYPEQWKTIESNVVSPAYFKTLGITLLRGRDFRADDDSRTPPVAIVNQAMARAFWPNHNAVGKFLWIKGTNAQVEVIGVAADIKQHEVWRASEPLLYEPFTQDFVPTYHVLIRAGGAPMSLLPAVRQQVTGLDFQVPVYGAETLDQVAADSMAEPRLAASLGSLFGALVLFLALAGIYSVIAYWVAQRTHEIGIRMALGAEKRDVLWMVFRQGLKLAFIGVAIGIAGALALTRFLASVLYGVKPTDPLTFIAVSLILIAVALVACYIPARRAAKVDPIVALRYE